jgi:hypothetical protein
VHLPTEERARFGMNSRRKAAELQTDFAHLAIYYVRFIPVDLLRAKE